MIDIHILILLIALACVVAFISKWLKIPYTIALVLMGLTVSTVQQPTIHLTEKLLLSVFLPALLFEAAWNIHLYYLKRYWLVISTLSLVGLLLSIAAVGSVLTFGLKLPLMISLLFGSMISATDPVSVIALFRQLNLTPKLATIVEAESLFNDGTAVVAFQLILAMVLTSTATAPPSGWLLIGSGITQFLMVSLGGMAVGSAYGFFFSWLIAKFNDHLLELMFTILVAYGSFLTADSLSLPGTGGSIHLSGVLATVSAGLVMGGLCRKQGMQPETMSVINSFWEFGAFFVNSILFLLIGLTIHVDFLMSHWEPIAAAIGTVLLARAISVFGLVPLINRIETENPVPKTWQPVLVWGGLRGALSMALALSLPKSLPERPLLIAMVFGVVLFTLLIQGLTISKLLKILKLST